MLETVTELWWLSVVTITSGSGLGSTLGSEALRSPVDGGGTVRPLPHPTELICSHGGPRMHPGPISSSPLLPMAH